MEAVVIYAEAERVGEGSQVVFDHGEAAVVGIGRVREIQGPDETGDLGDNGGAEQVVEIKAAVAVAVAPAIAIAVDGADNGLIRIMRYEHGLVDQAGDPVKRVEQVMDAGRAGSP